MLVKINTAAVQGLTAVPVTAEVNASRGMQFFLVGLPDNAVKESHERIMAAINNCGFRIPVQKIVVNLTPADLKKEGAAYDLPIAIGMLAVGKELETERLERFMMLGELSLDGSLLPVKGLLPTAIMARRLGYEGLIVPQANAREAAVVNQLKVYGASHLQQVVDLLNGSPQAIEPTEVNTRDEFYARQNQFDIDFSDVKGQEAVKRAMEVAAAGGHNMIMVGPPGSGKSMMAKRLPTILPPLTLQESLETTQIHSVAGKLDRNTSLIANRPFRSPHHTISQVALVGGGQNPQPGEISLAHNGVLFCDELPEFSRSVLEVMRQPLEDREIHVARSKYSVTYPASFMFVASMNPCPCGYYNHPTRRCVCTPGQVTRYLNKISGPLLDRIDIQVMITPLTFEEMSVLKQGECSEQMRERVIRARKVQAERYRDIPGVHCNAQMTSALMRRYAQPATDDLGLLRNAMQRYHLSARAYDRILRLARTIADLDGAENIGRPHLIEAIGYRNLDRSTWGE